MIVVAGTVRIRPEAREAAAEAALAMIAATRREPGCRAYRFASDLADPTLIHVHEEWDSAEALERHFATPHMAEFRQKLPGLVAGPGSFMRYEIASATPM